MTSDLDIFVGNTTLIDEEVYQLWLDGHSGAPPDPGVSPLPGHLGPLSWTPRVGGADPKVTCRAALLVGGYYAFEESFARELLGKKLSKGTKKDLDEISARTGVSIKSCRRQVDIGGCSLKWGG
uniref:Uncharacterized protein n=1 Tax=Buteo japonicus TaxID=224669 RepID=A0A8C0AZC7_9AVES